MIAKTLAAVALVGVLVAPTAASAHPATGSPVHPHVRTVTQKANGTRVSLRQTVRLRVNLPTAVDGGYRWHLQACSNRDVARIVHKKLVADPHRSGVVGYGYHTIYTLRMRGTGTTTLYLAETQAGSSTDARHFRLTIHVVR